MTDEQIVVEGVQWDRDAELRKLENSNRRDLAAALAEIPPELRPVETFADVLTSDEPDLAGLPFLGRDGFIVEGWSHLMASAPRVGKTELIGQAMVPWLRLGKRIMWLSEESRSLWRDRIGELTAMFGSRVPWNKVQLVPTIGADPHDLLRVAIASDANVVIADTLRHVTGMRDENDAAEVRRCVSPWLRAMAERDVTFVALTHHRKGPQGDSGGERVAGSHAIVGLFDVILELGRVEGQENRRKLSGRSRRHEVPTIIVERDDDARMIVLGDGRSVSRQDTDRRVVATLTAAGELLTTRQVQVAMGPSPPSVITVARSLTRLAHVQAVRRFPEIDEPAGGQVVRWAVYDLFGS